MIGDKSTSVKKDTKKYSKFDKEYSFLGKKRLNGAVNPVAVFKTNSVIKISREDLMKILVIENKIRLDKKTLKKLDDQKDDMQKMYKIDGEVIKAALKDFGFNPEKDDSFKAYLLATGKYINDPELKELVVWMKYDKMKMGDLMVGDDYFTEETKNIELYTLQNKKVIFTSLLQEDRYNVIVSGSYSWPPFRTIGVEAIEEWFQDKKLQNLINIIVIYISEAHAVDEWNLSNKFSINQHKNIEERIKICDEYVNKKFNISFNIYCDSLEKEKSYEKIYSAWPERGYIVYKGKIEYISVGLCNEIVDWPKHINSFFKEKFKI